MSKRSKQLWGTSELRSAQCESSGQKLVSNFVALRQSLQNFFTSTATLSLLAKFRAKKEPSKTALNHSIFPINLKLTHARRRCSLALELG